MATTIPSDVLAPRVALTTPAEEHVMGMGWLRDWPDQRDYTADHPAVRSELETLQIAEPADVAHAVSFFASDGAGYITGQVLSVSGGLTMAG